MLDFLRFLPRLPFPPLSRNQAPVCSHYPFRRSSSRLPFFSSSFYALNLPQVPFFSTSIDGPGFSRSSLIFFSIVHFRYYALTYYYCQPIREYQFVFFYVESPVWLAVLFYLFIFPLLVIVSATLCQSYHFSVKNIGI